MTPQTEIDTYLADDRHDYVKARALLQAASTELTHLRLLVTTLQQENRQWRTWGIVEIAVRNPNVASYTEHWEGRALKAEASLASLTGIVQEVREQLSSHLTEYDDPCADRGAEWPCDVARALDRLVIALQGVQRPAPSAPVQEIP
jgi:hypothetical protein